MRALHSQNERSEASQRAIKTSFQIWNTVDFDCFSLGIQITSKAYIQSGSGIIDGNGRLLPKMRKVPKARVAPIMSAINLIVDTHRALQ